jgi:ornithine cyclodeaminase
VPATGQVVVLGSRDVQELLPIDECIDLMRDALASLARGDAQLPLRTVMRMPDGKSFLAVMPGRLSGKETSLGLKAVAIFPGNARLGLDTHQGAVLMLDPQTGRPAGLLDAASITAIRTAAVSAVATDALALHAATHLAILGAGVQAATHLQAIAAVRRLADVRVWNRTDARAEEFVAKESKRFPFPIAAVSTPQAAVDGADIIVTVTASPVPVLQRSWVKAGAHINAVGSSTPSAREIDTATVADARVFVDRRESAESEAGDILIPVKEGRIGLSHIKGEIGEVIIGKVPGRTAPTEITLFKSLGLAVEDLASASYLMARAREAGVGARVEL